MATPTQCTKGLARNVAALFVVTIIVAACDAQMDVAEMASTPITLKFRVELPYYANDWVAGMDDCTPKSTVPCATDPDYSTAVTPSTSPGTVSSNGARTTVPSGSVGNYLSYAGRLKNARLVGGNITAPEVADIVKARNIFATSANLFKRAVQSTFYTYYDTTAFVTISIKLPAKYASFFRGAPANCNSSTGACDTIDINLFNCGNPRSGSTPHPGPDPNSKFCHDNHFPKQLDINRVMQYYAIADLALALAE